MRFLGIDLETTGIEFDKYEITEVGVVLIEAPLLQSKPLIENKLMCKVSGEVSDEITELTKITKPMLEEFGHPLKTVLESLEILCVQRKPDFIVAHNGEIFDKPWLKYHAEKSGVDLSTLLSTPWIDTAADIPESRFGTRKLSYMAAECGFLNHGAHSALDDVKTMLRVLGHCDLPLIIERSKEPWVVVRAFTDYTQKELAKKAKFSWQDCGSGKVYDKQWVKRMKKNDFEAFQKIAPFKCAIVG